MEARMDQLLLIGYRRSGRWVLLNDRAIELGDYPAESAIIEAATERLQRLRREGSLLIETGDGWRETPLPVV